MSRKLTVYFTNSFLTPSNRALRHMGRSRTRKHRMPNRRFLRFCAWKSKRISVGHSLHGRKCGPEHLAPDAVYEARAAKTASSRCTGGSTSGRTIGPPRHFGMSLCPAPRCLTCQISRPARRTCLRKDAILKGHFRGKNCANLRIGSAVGYLRGLPRIPGSAASGCAAAAKT